MDVVHGSDGKSNCESLASVVIYTPDQRSMLENDPIQSHSFDADGKPLDDNAIVQLADKRYAIFRGPQATCLKGEGASIEAARATESKVRGILYTQLMSNIESL